MQQFERETDLSREWAGVWLIAITALAAALRLVEMNSSFWADELWTRMCAQHGLRWTLTMWGVSLNPGYMYMPALSGALFGAGEAALRLPGFLAGVLAAPALYALLSEVHSRRAGLAGAFLLAVNAYHVDYSVEARMYSCVMFGAVLLVWTLYRATVHGGAWKWAHFVLAGLWSVPLHLIVVPFLGAITLGAVCHRVLDPSRASWRQRVLAVVPVVICAIAAMASMAVFMSLAGFSPTVFIQGWHDGEAEQGTHVPNEIDLNAAFRLSPADFLGFLEQYTAVQPVFFQLVFLVLAIAGLCVAWKRSRALFWISSAPLLVLPPAFFFMTTTHFWSHRHLCFFLPIIALWTALGMTAVADRAPGAFRAAGIPDFITPRQARRISLMALALFAAFPSVDALRQVYVRRPAEDAKGVAEYIADRITPADTFCYFSPRARFWTDFTITLAGGRAAQASSTARSLLADSPTSENLAKLITQEPERTFWFVELGTLPESSGSLLEKLGAAERPFRGAEVCVLGEPTSNLIALGGAEDAAKYENLRPVLAGGEEAYSGESCFRLDNRNGKGGVVELSAARPAYTLRNSGFEVWDRGTPSGWRVSPADAVLKSEPRERSGRALALVPGARSVVVEQRIVLGLAPGRKVTVSADVKAAQPGEIALGLAYDVPGARHEGETPHPGGNSWQRLVYEADIPAEAYPNSFAVTLRVAPDASVAPLVDNVTIQVPALLGELDPEREYTLSLMVKYDRLISAEPDATVGRMGKMSLVWYDAKTERARDLRLDHWAGHSGWRRLVYRVTPGVTLPAGASYVKVVAALAKETVPEGAIWLDEIQFEPLPYATPFVQGTRPPHDEALARLDPAGKMGLQQP